MLEMHIPAPAPNQGVLIPAVKIEITRAEGLHSEVTGIPEVCTRETMFGIWDCADSILMKWSHTAPKEGGYDKCDFKITFEDGETYSGRYDLKHNSIEYPNLAKHVWGFTTFHAGVGKPGHLTQEDYNKYLTISVWSGTIPEFKKFIQTYEIGYFNAQAVKAQKKGLLVSTFRSPGSEATMGGLSSKHDKFIITGPDIPGIFEPGDDAPELVLDQIRDHLFVRPPFKPAPGNVGWMFGGNFVFTSDSRFPIDYPLPVHDRQETQAPAPAPVKASAELPRCELPVSA